jgi:hypothetical protein
VGLGAAAYMASQSKDATPLYVGILGGSFVLDGVLIFIVPGRMEEIAAYGHERGVSPAQLEDAWVAAARRERSTRRVAGILGLVGSGLAIGFGAFVLSDTGVFQNDATARNTYASFFLALGAFDGILGAYDLATDGPIESALHAYEQSSGRKLWPQESALGPLHVAFTPGGVMGSLSTAW